MPAPIEIRLNRAGKTLDVIFDDGARFAIAAELLRVESPSAEVQGHSPDQKKLVSGRRNVGIVGVEPVGNYAVRLTFDDLHETGIYSWDYLYRLGTESVALWSNYVAELESKGLSRDPAPA